MDFKGVNFKKLNKEIKKVSMIMVGIGVVTLSSLFPQVAKAEERVQIPSFKNTSAWTGLGISNPNPNEDLDYSIIIRDANGEVLSDEKYNLVSNGQTAFVPGNNVADLEGKLASIEVKADGPLNILELVGDTIMKQVSANYNASIGNWTYPHLATKDGWSSIVRIQNNINGENSGVLEVYNMDGSLNSSKEITLNGKGVTEIDIGKEFGEVDGSIKVVFDNGISSFLSYINPSSNYGTSLVPIPTKVLFYGDGMVTTGGGDLVYMTENGERTIKNPFEVPIKDEMSDEIITDKEINPDNLEGRIKAISVNGKTILIKEDTPTTINGVNSTYSVENGNSISISPRITDTDTNQRVGEVELYKNGTKVKDLTLDEFGNTRIYLTNINGTNEYEIKTLTTTTDGKIVDVQEKIFKVIGYTPDDGGGGGAMEQ